MLEELILHPKIQSLQEELQAQQQAAAAPAPQK